MKGIVYKDYFGCWMIKSGDLEYPIHPYQRTYQGLPLEQGMEVEFFLDDFWETGLEEVIKVADISTKCYCGHTDYCDCGPKT